jgi:hypothetical protein
VVESFSFKNWFVEYSAEDGGRIKRLLYNGLDLLTREPAFFHPPVREHGRYEDRPVYGYDDCFPSVVACRYPNTNVNIPDHGELCWRRWEVVRGLDNLIFRVRSQILPLAFMRRMDFTKDSILWSFETRNDGTETFPFQHVMHPLIALSQLKSIEFPEFQTAFDWNEQMPLRLKRARDIGNYLINLPPRSYSMIFLQNVSAGHLKWTYNNGLNIMLTFPVELFPTVGVWWNNCGYPEEDNIRRDECSFEPVPGFTSSLAQAYTDGNCLYVQPGKCFKWQIKWEIS